METFLERLLPEVWEILRLCILDFATSVFFEVAYSLFFEIACSVWGGEGFYVCREQFYNCGSDLAVELCIRKDVTEGYAMIAL